MPVTDESIQNFRRAGVGDALLGILDRTSGDIHLALVEPRDGGAIPSERYSSILTNVREPLPGVGGHSLLAGWAGVGGARQVRPGVAEGSAFGFSIVKTAVNGFTIGTLKSGLNVQYDPVTHPRPPIPAGSRPNEEARTLPAAVADVVLAQLEASLS